MLPVRRGELRERDALRPGPVVGVAQDQLVELFGSKGVLLVERVVPIVTSAFAPRSVGEQRELAVGGAVDQLVPRAHGGGADVRLETESRHRRFATAAEVGHPGDAVVAPTAGAVAE